MPVNDAGRLSVEHLLTFMACNAVHHLGSSFMQGQSSQSAQFDNGFECGECFQVYHRALIVSSAVLALQCPNNAGWAVRCAGTIARALARWRSDGRNVLAQSHARGPEWHGASGQRAC
jgi:hypothetical protein